MNKKQTRKWYSTWLSPLEPNPQLIDKDLYLLSNELECMELKRFQSDVFKGNV